jgi:hypothetical protein
VVALVFLAVPQLFIAPLLSAAVGWGDSFEYNPTLVRVKSGDIAARPEGWYWDYSSTRDRRAFVRRAAGYSSLAWGESNPDRNRCRHVMSHNSIPVNSTLENAVLPCIQVHSITFPDQLPGEVKNFVRSITGNNAKDDRFRAEGSPFKYLIDGNAILYNPDDLPGLREKPPPDGNTNHSREFPKNFMLSNTLNAVVMVSGQSPNSCSSETETIFGGAWFHNTFRRLGRG